MALEVTDGSINKMEYLTEGVYTEAAHQHFSFDLVSKIDARAQVGTQEVGTAAEAEEGEVY